ncbi:hypothetical protein ACFYWP_23675 [Actinacidiphila glaucinigra]|uniref:hypothetical protein n=1 Tax=Actinacidiphila glaucinigra TaxID=235986 RepID=UPI0036A41B22
MALTVHIVISMAVAGASLWIFSLGRKQDWKNSWNFSDPKPGPPEDGTLSEKLALARYRGRKDWILGWMVQVGGLATLAPPYFVRMYLNVGALATKGWVLFQISLTPLVVLGLMLANRGRKRRLLARRKHVPCIESPESVQSGSYVLYLRTFDDDKHWAFVEPLSVPNPGEHLYDLLLPGASHEEDMADAVSPVGPMIAVGSPDEDLPHAGALRMYFPKSDWKRPVSRLMERARLVVISLGTGDGTIWEVAEAMCVVPPQRLLLIVPGEMEDEEYDRVREEVSRELLSRRTSMDRRKAREKFETWPTIPARPKRTSRFEIEFIRFADGWVSRPIISLGYSNHPMSNFFRALTEGLYPVFDELQNYEKMIGRRWG